MIDFDGMLQSFTTHPTRRMIEEIFSEAGDFRAMCAAEAWCDSRGISVGACQRGAARGLMYGDHDIAKWRNLDQSDRDALDGVMTGDMRHGPVRVWIVGPADAEETA